MPPLLRIEELHRQFAPRGRVVRAVDGVSLEVAPGESVGVVGESGSGKSTLARCAVRLLIPTSGRVWFDGIDLETLKPGDLRHKRREFQIIFQDASGSLDPRMTVLRILLEPLEAHRMWTRGQREGRVRELLGEVGLEPAVANRFPSELSGGEQQRVAIARALAPRPRLLIADEPVSALDASVQAQVLNVLDDVRRRSGVAVLLISHDLSVVRYACERVLVMYMGRIVEERRTEDLFRNPLHPYARLLLDSMPAAFATVHASPEASRAGRPGWGCCAFYPRCARALPACATTAPPLEPQGEGDKVACFLYT